MPTAPSSDASSRPSLRLPSMSLSWREVSAMPVEIRVPPLGESVTEATVASWLKHESDVVEAGEPLVELETDKVNVDVAAERSGVLTSILVASGATVQPGDVLAMVAEAGSAAADGGGDGTGSATADGTASAASNGSAS